MDEVLRMGRLGRNREDFTGGRRRDGRHPGPAIGRTFWRLVLT